MFSFDIKVALLLGVLLVSGARSLELDEQQIPVGSMDFDLTREKPVAKPYGPASYPFAPAELEPNRPVEGEWMPHEVVKRSSGIFRPLFATRERDAERRQVQEKRREYWAGEERRRSAQAYPAARYPAQQYRPYPVAGYPVGR